MSRSELLVHLSRDTSEQIVAGSFIGALCFQACSLVFTFKDEIDYVWSLPKRSAPKWLFFFLRYFALLAQIGHQFQDLVDSKVAVTRGVCIIWYLLDVVTMEAVIMAVELVLMLRVFKLYRRQRKVGRMLGGGLVFEVITMITITTVTLPKVEFNSHCAVTVRWPTITAFGVGVLVNHLLVLGVTLYKGYKFSQNTYRDSRTLLIMVVRDGILTFVGLLSATVINVIIFAVVENSLSIIGSPWIIAIMSTAGCKIITNIEAAARDLRDHSPSTGIELTTNALGVGDTQAVYSNY